VNDQNTFGIFIKLLNKLPLLFVQRGSLSAT
jgi:hypothetical protein